MPGNPIKRARREQRAQSGRPQVPAMRRPKVPAELWRRMTDLERIVALLGLSIDDVHQLLSIPFEEADLHEKALKVRIFETLWKFAARLNVEKQRDFGREEALTELAKALIKRDEERVRAPLNGFGGSGDVE